MPTSRPVLGGYYENGKCLVRVVGINPGAVELEDARTEKVQRIGLSVFRIRWRYVWSPPPEGS